jgi:hypothetical protein
MQTVSYSTSLVLNSRVLLMYTDTVEELPVYPVQNSPSGCFTGRQLPPLSSVLYGIILRRRSVLAAQLLLREKSGA